MAENHRRTKSVEASDVIRRKGILIDIDVVKPPNAAKCSSTEAEHKAARARAIEITEYLIKAWFPLSDDERLPYPIFNDSGNGAQILIPADLPNDDATHDLIRDLLYALARRFPSDGITQIDTTVFNAGRFTKLAGTLACKGPHTAERPHRLAKILLFPLAHELVMPVTPAMLQAIIDDNPAADEREAKPPAASATVASNSDSAKTSNLRSFYENLGAKNAASSASATIRPSIGHR